MNIYSLLFWTSLTLFPKFATALDHASFYGSSSIAIPLREAKSSTDIHFKFRTHLHNALILLVAGQTDHCIVAISNGRLKVNINLGAGESELYSSHNLKLSDFKWHDVFIVRKEGDLSMIIDNSYKFRTHLSGDFFELNIHYGLFLGGQGNRTDLFYGHMENFRGCLAEVMYNGILVLDQARHRQSQANVHGVTWNCAAEFDAGVDRPISFVEDGAYMTVAQTVSHNFKLQLEFKTLLDHSMILYNSGPVSKPDLFALEIFKSKLKVTFKHADKIQEITTDGRVSDGKWHKFSLKLNANSIDIIIDGQSKQMRLPHSHLMDFVDTFYVGGIEANKRTRAISKGVKTADSSFKGCIRHLTITEKLKGLPDVHVSEGLLPGCVWQYPCLESPCVDGTCVQQGIDSFKCDCKPPCKTNNASNDQKVMSHSSFATDLELLSLEPLDALEGQNVLLSPNNLHMVLDYPKFGIRDTGIKFTLTSQPAHGNVLIDIWPNDKNIFTLADVARDKVHYIHDGSETLEDRIGLEVEFSASDMFILPAYLQGKFQFHLNVKIAPVNDPPTLKITSSSVLRVPQGAKKTIDKDLLTVVDPDSTSKHLVFSIIDAGPGHFEYNYKPTVPIISFTLSDIDAHEVAYVHHANAANESHITVQVSDGIETSTAGKIRVSAFQQYWRLKNNTGIVLMHLTTALITPFNLSFASNVQNTTETAQFFIEQGPQYGVVEVEKDIGSWENSVIFTSEDIRQHRVRYRHITSRPEVDEFQFRTTLNKSVLYTFRMTFAKCKLYAVNFRDLALNGTNEKRITLENLMYQTDPVKSSSTAILYRIVNPPLYGYLYSAVSKYRMRTHDVFSQEDLQSGHIKYSLHRRGYSTIHDQLQLGVSAPGCKNITSNFSITFWPNEESLKHIQGKVTLVRVQVEEGSSVSIFTTHLNIEIDHDLIFNVTVPPRHGILQVAKGNMLRNNTKYFTLKDVRNDYLSYVHDDSETRHDSFQFMALSDDDTDFEYADTMHVDVLLKNDNSPMRTVDKIFNVVVGGERLLTSQDLAYSDVDLDTKPSEIIYTFKDLPNGEFFNNKKTMIKLSEFTQEDLNENRVLFKHRGAEYGKVKFWVTDGPYYVSGVLEVQASAPFIRPITNKRLIVQQGKASMISADHLNYNTNLYSNDEDVVYQVIGKPTFGQIVYTESGKVCHEFYQSQLNNGLISYRNDMTGSSADEINLKMKCHDASNTAQVSVLMLPASYWEPLHIKTLRQLVVEESTSAIISKAIIEVSSTNILARPDVEVQGSCQLHCTPPTYIIQPQVPPSAITYHIATLPENGYISILPTAANIPDQSTNVRSFTQSFMNENRVIYIQSVANETKDRIVFNVTNGMVWLYGLALEVQIIPERLYLGSNIINVNEGGTSLITSVHLYIATEYYKSRVSDYVILEEPAYGCIQVHKRCNKLHGFSHKELMNGLIQYAHNGSENLQDSFVLIAVAGEKRSIPVVVNIKIIPINDQKPRLVNNTGLVMWEGGTAVITNSMLAAVDDDRPKETLKYQVLTAWWGNVSLLSDSGSFLKFFTQELIDRQMVVFRHQNGSDAKFTFNVSDGLHSTKEFTFNIRTKAVRLALHHQPLHIFPLQRKYLTATYLLAHVSDPEREIIFDVTIGPSLGRLMMESTDTPGIFNVISKFTQNDLNNSRVFYEHIHPFAGLYANDSFTFNIKSHLAEPLLNKRMKIDISVSSGGLDAYVNIPKITVDEGGITTIHLNFSGVVAFLENHAGLREPVIHASAELPQHGQLFLQNQSNITTFTQQQLEAGEVKYQHDHSDSLGDNLYFSLYLIPGYILLCNLTVPLIINPINDQPFKLVTPAPHLVVVQGENHTITAVELCTEDIDTPPAELLYDIISGPQEGKVVLMPEGIAINHFSQADVDNNRLMYIHNSSVLTDTFHLRVWDGKFRPEYTVFNVKVHPIGLNVSKGLPVFIQQGMNVVLLSPKQFVVDTNANRNKIQYKVTTAPRHGVLFVKDNSAHEFGQDDLDNDRVMYMQRDMTTANDSMVVFVGIIYGNVSVGEEIQVDIKVQPLMQVGNCTVLAGEVNKLSLHVLDATPLAKLTNSNPRYLVTCQPQYGEVRKIIRSSGEQRNVLNTLITGFSHEEVQSGLIYIAIRDIEVGWNGVVDKFCFVLAATIFQPATGELKLIIKSPLHNDIHSTLAGPNDPAGHEGGLHFASPNMTRDYFLIVSMVAGVVILGVAVIIIIKCRSYEVEELNKDQSMQPLPLPRPPDRLMSSSPPLKHLDGYVSPIPATLPHCKVTPISRTDLDANTRYPYGTDEHSADEWSSCDASDPACPNRNNIRLRRNQYWV